MTDNSEFVLRWVIDDVNAIVAARKAKSKVFNMGGFKWTAALDDSTSSSWFGGHKAEFTLHCDANHNGPWKCAVEMVGDVLGDDVYEAYLPKSRHVFDETNFNWRYEESTPWKYFKDCKINGTTTIHLTIKIIRSKKNHPHILRSQPIVDSTLFDAPNSKSNVILKIGDKKLHVSKEYLAVHSPVFDIMFFGNFSENGKEEVEIKDVVYAEFVDLLNLLYHRTSAITDYTVPHILKLSDQYQMQLIVALSKKHLTHSKGIDTMKKLLLADQYRLNSLKDHCLASFTSAAELTKKIKSSPKFARLSDEMKAAICHRMTEF